MSEAEALIRELVHFMTTKRAYDEDDAYELFARVNVFLTRCTAARAHRRVNLDVIQGGKQ